MPKFKGFSKDKIFAAIYTGSEERFWIEGEDVLLSRIAKDYEKEGYDHLDDITRPGSNSKNFGLFGLLGVISVSIRLGHNKKPQIIEAMQFSAPGLSRVFCGHLLDLLTGNDVTRHAIKVTSQGTYQNFN